MLWCGNPVYIQLQKQQQQQEQEWDEQEEREQPVWYFQQSAKIYLGLHAHRSHEKEIKGKVTRESCCNDKTGQTNITVLQTSNSNKTCTL
jgi:hypothetical protein